MSNTAAANKQQSVPLTSLPLQTLAQLQQQLTNELETLGDSYQKLRAAQGKFKDCVKSIDEGLKKPGSAGKDVLVPLTASLYVPGKIKDTSAVMVDVGTGFFVEKTTDEAIVFYNDKIKELEGNCQSLEAIVQGKAETVRSVEEVMRQKALQSQAQSSKSE